MEKRFKLKKGWKQYSSIDKIIIIVSGIIGAIIFLATMVGIGILFSSHGFSFSLPAESTQIVDMFYSEFNNKDYNAMLELIHEDWYEGAIKTKDGTISFLDFINTEYGSVVNYTLIKWKVNKLDVYYGEDSDKGVESYIDLIYSVERENGSSTDTFSIYKSENEERYWIRGFHTGIQ